MSDLIDLVEKILRKYPLCDNCLGRLFASLGRGLTNDLRGRSLKTVLLMDLFRRYYSEDPKKLSEELKIFARNGGEPFTSSLKILSGEEIETEKCFICRSEIKRFIEDFSDRVSEILREKNIDRFILGVKMPKDYSEREETVAREYGIIYWESIKKELKREIGKNVLRRGFKPDFDDPNVVLTIDVGTGAIVISYPSAIYMIKVWKNERGHLIKGSKDSLENMIKEKLALYEPSEVRIHLVARDSRRYRILGNGVVAILEIHSPRRGKPSVKDLNEIIGKIPPFEVKILSRINRRDIEEINTKFSRLIYEIKISSDEDVDEDLLRKIIDEYKNGILITQKTPTRLLERGYPDVMRRSIVNILEHKILSSNRFIMKISADKRIYIEEFIKGDNDRTTPSLSQLLNKKLDIEEIDIIDHI